MKKLFVLLFLMLFFVSTALAETIAVITFQAPTTRIDNTLFCSFVGQQYCPYAGMKSNPVVVAPDGTHPVEILQYTLYYGECSNYPANTPSNVDYFTTNVATKKIILPVSSITPLPAGTISALSSSTTYTLGGLTAGQCYYFGATATDVDNQESSVSTNTQGILVSKTTQTLPPPSAPNFPAPVTGRR